MKCPKCEKEFDPEEAFAFDSFGMCDDCVDEYFEEEEKDFKAYNDQNGKCFLCGIELYSWNTRIIKGELRAVHMNCYNILTNK